MKCNLFLAFILNASYVLILIPLGSVYLKRVKLKLSFMLGLHEDFLLHTETGQCMFISQNAFKKLD